MENKDILQNIFDNTFLCGVGSLSVTMPQVNVIYFIIYYYEAVRTNLTNGNIQREVCSIWYIYQCIVLIQVMQ